MAQMHGAPVIKLFWISLSTILAILGFLFTLIMAMPSRDDIQTMINAKPSPYVEDRLFIKSKLTDIDEKLRRLEDKLERIGMDEKIRD